MLYYCPQIWCSDDTDAYERTKIQYGTSFFYPVSAVGSHVSTVPNHQTGRITPFETRGTVAMAGSFGYELDLNLLSDGEKQEVAEQIRQFKTYGPLIHNGKYYRLTNPMAEDAALWEFAAQDGSEVLVQECCSMQRQMFCAAPFSCVDWMLKSAIVWTEQSRSIPAQR